jgi:hypothetical protein
MLLEPVLSTQMDTESAVSAPQRPLAGYGLLVCAGGALLLGSLLMVTAALAGIAELSIGGTLVVRFAQLLAVILVVVSAVALFRRVARPVRVKAVIGIAAGVLIVVLGESARDLIWWATVTEFQTHR